jgi:hypothetical protein
VIHHEIGLLADVFCHAADGLAVIDAFHQPDLERGSGRSGIPLLAPMRELLIPRMLSDG